VLERLPFAGILPPIAWLPFFRSLFDLRACFGPIHAAARRTALSGQALLAALAGSDPNFMGGKSSHSNKKSYWRHNSCRHTPRIRR
jgi:hypothetical protein